MDQRTDNFLIAAFDAIRREIEQGIKEIGEFLRYALVACGAIWAWLLSQKQANIPRIASFIPFALSIMLLVHVRLKRKSVRRMGSYLLRIEQNFNLSEHLGWESQQAEWRKMRDFSPKWDMIVWITLCLANFAGAVLTLIWR